MASNALRKMAAWKPTEVELVKELVAKGEAAQRIGLRVGRTAKAVRNLASELGIPAKSKIEQRTPMGLASRWSSDALLQDCHSTANQLHPRTYR